MEMEKTELKKFVSAVRKTKRVGELMQTMMSSGVHPDTLVDEAFYALMDLMLEYTGETEDNMEETETWRLLFMTYEDDEKVAEKLIRISEDRKGQKKTSNEQAGEKAGEKVVEILKSEIETLRMANMSLRGWLRESGNELCYQCGEYENEHLGACNGCRWRTVKSGGEPA